MGSCGVWVKGPLFYMTCTCALEDCVSCVSCRKDRTDDTVLELSGQDCLSQLVTPLASYAIASS